jgi:hypothetical protein
LTFLGLYELNPLKPPYTLKMPKTRVMPKTAHIPKTPVPPKNAYALKTASFPEMGVYLLLHEKQRNTLNFHPVASSASISSSSYYLSYQGGANRGIQNRPKTGTP